MYGDLKLTFIQKVMNDYLESVQDGMRILIRRTKAEDTLSLLNSIDGRTKGSPEQTVGELIFHEYGRMLDMGTGRGHPLGGVRVTKLVLQASNGSGVVDTNKRTRKRKIIYSKIAYGKLNYLESQLLYGFTEETIAILKNELNGTS